MQRAQNTLRQSESSEVNISPMIDMVFILLIFFVVAAVFVEESGFEATRPDVNGPPEMVDLPPMGIHIDEQNRIYVGEELATLSSIRSKVAQMVAMSSELDVILNAAPLADAGLMIEVMDQVRLGGVDLISLSLDTR